ncbi:hypothetical protein FHS18_002311 [Paenibacillus phyllosphaerae]|uniref:Uncharacterized protein n=1 Tax=Paenibacillus phyllosphaerae TaxID=274593 RepID=A0A7W5AXF3_9BACL|nr:hypothetical protein [Paenibacillus phyllosphaerae]MBB3110244.1 hypothetical protein [Paenibacillus phyllosphaerae]
MPYTTGIVTNTRDFGTAATNVIVSTHNMDQNASATIIVHIFAVPETTLVLTPVYQVSYSVAADSADIRSFNIAGNVAYVVQMSIITPIPNSIFSVFGLDEFGNLVTNQGILQSELTFIPALTPIP